MNIHECKEKLIADKKTLAGLRFKKNVAATPEQRKDAEDAIRKTEAEIAELEKQLRHPH